MKGTVTSVNIGPLVIEGLLMEDGTFGIAQQQVAAIFSVIPTSAPKWLKSILGEGFQLFQVTTNRNEVPKGKLLRDYLPEKMLHQVEASETMLCRWLDNGLSPDEAMDRL